MSRHAFTLTLCAAALAASTAAATPQPAPASERYPGVWRFRAMPPSQIGERGNCPAAKDDGTQGRQFTPLGRLPKAYVILLSADTAPKDRTIEVPDCMPIERVQ